MKLLFANIALLVLIAGCDSSAKNSPKETQSVENASEAVEGQPDSRDATGRQGDTSSTEDQPAAQEPDRYQFGESNLTIRFPAQPQVSTTEFGNRYDVAESNTKISVEVNKTTGESREALLDAIQQSIRDNPAALIFETTPVKWRGHAGREWAFFHEGRADTNYLTRCRDIFVEGTMYQLRYESVFVASGGDPELMRHRFTDEANEFFDSMRLLEFVPPSNVPSQQTFLGRWIVVRENGRKVDGGDSLVFAGGTKFGAFKCGNEKEWGIPDGGVRQRGFFKCSEETDSNWKLEIHLLADPANPFSASCKFDNEALVIEFESTPAIIGLGKSYRLRRPGDLSVPNG